MKHSLTSLIWLYYCSYSSWVAVSHSTNKAQFLKCVTHNPKSQAVMESFHGMWWAGPFSFWSGFWEFPSLSSPHWSDWRSSHTAGHCTFLHRVVQNFLKPFSSFLFLFLKIVTNSKPTTHGHFKLFLWSPIPLPSCYSVGWFSKVLLGFCIKLLPLDHLLTAEAPGS